MSQCVGARCCSVLHSCCCPYKKGNVQVDSACSSLHCQPREHPFEPLNILERLSVEMRQTLNGKTDHLSTAAATTPMTVQPHETTLRYYSLSLCKRNIVKVSRSLRYLRCSTSSKELRSKCNNSKARRDTKKHMIALLF